MACRSRMSMEPALLLAKSARLQQDGTWVPGTFAVCASKISWETNDSTKQPKELHVGLISVTNTQRAKTKPMLRLVAGTSDYTFQFDTLQDRDDAVDAFSQAKELMGQAGASGAADSGAKAMQSVADRAPKRQRTASGAGAASAQLTAAQKREMLKADAELGERYNTLVVAAGVLSEEEFWAGVLAERAKAAASGTAGPGASGSAAPASAGPALPPPPDLAAQRKGLANAMFQVPVEQDGRSVAMRFTLTPDLIALVFAEKPHVRAAYARNVPTHMTEREFWTRYIKHEMAKEERRNRLVRAADGGEGGAAAAGLDAAPLEHAGLFGDGGDGGGAGGAGRGGGGGGGAEELPGTRTTGDRRVRRMLAASDPLVNIAADEADGFTQGFGLLHAANKEPGVKAGLRAVAEELARDINRHATVVLAGCRALGGGDGSGGSRGVSSPGAAQGASGSGGLGPEEERLDDLAAERVKQYGAGLEDLNRRPQPTIQVLTLRPPAGAGQPQEATQAAPARGGTGGGLDVKHREGPQSTTLEAVAALAKLDPNALSHAPISSNAAYQALMDICGVGGEGSVAGRGGGLAAGATQLPPDAVLAPALLGKLRTQTKVVCDVARHFWACMPPTAPEAFDRAARLADHVDRVLWPEAEATLAAANSLGGPQRPAVRALLAPVQSMMEALLARWKEEAGRAGLPQRT